MMEQNEMTERIEVACDRAIGYLTARQSLRGGFCFYRTDWIDEPNLSDTYHAARALTRLGRTVPRREAARAFVMPFTASLQPSHLFYAISLLEMLEPGQQLAVDLRTRIASLRAAPAQLSPGAYVTGRLERARWVAQLKSLVGDRQAIADLAEVVSNLQNQGGFGSTPNLWDTWLALDILRLHGGPISRRQDVEDFMASVQRSPAGFTATRQSRMVNLETIFAGVTCCAMLGLPIRYPHHALTFVLGCQDLRGGFASSPGALPNIELTDRALKSIAALRVEPEYDRPSC